MKPLVSYDTETTGMPDWKTPSDGENQPHIVQLSAVKHDPETKELIGELDLIIKPDGWVIPQETIDIHGITNEHAIEVGIPEKEAIQQLLDFCEGSERIAYNRTFDQRIVRIGLKRFFDEKAQEQWAQKDDHHCSMFLAKKAMKAGKNPKLVEAYKHFIGKELEGAHNALNDAKASMAVYFAVTEPSEPEESAA
ncbi:3'-5' exonuclease [Pseudoalteromonas neustonica]|uniref:3'-5' exonuclease n=1 Tax=Pseudoalteromonas neustonica TaxID=1840331 RepID=A0ABY3F7G4_9GAMM|nr:3'-5' exonuclease [Pseudoalteromonas neustonica]TVU79888.1 3'-5' exonuclease [Pseudoalteromonas neustonica]